jgi:PcfJ-like protein
VRKERSLRKFAKQQLDDAIHAGRSLAARHHEALAAYERLLAHVRSRTTLLRASDRPRDYRTALNRGLLAIALHHTVWLRPVETWLPTDQRAWPQLTELANHLFARYAVPAFMTSVWFDLPPGEILAQHGWYKHLGLGRNIRTAGLPMRVTRAMAHRFMQAPHHYTAVAALRWAQVLGLGGSEALARAAVGTRLGKMLENESFWESVLHFLINHPSFDLAQVGPLVDFVQHQRFEWREGVSPDGVFGGQPPPQPDFSMKGRTVASIRRLIEEWHKQLGREMHQRCFAWLHSRFNDFRLVQRSGEHGQTRVWTITELRTSQALFVEGKAMRHCVATYAVRCGRGHSSIWSMELENRRGRHRVLTIEVDMATRTICQARRFGNRLPQAAEREILEQWAARERLSIPESLRPIR